MLLDILHIFRFKTGESRLVNKQSLLWERCKTVSLVNNILVACNDHVQIHTVMFVSKDLLEVTYFFSVGTH